MPQAVTVYRWDDPGAPQIVERRPSEIIAILKKCLVEGYGAKAPLGWSILFEDVATTKIIFQNSIAAGGSGGVLRVNTGNAGNEVNSNTFFTPAKAAVDIDNLFQEGHRHRGQFLNAQWTRWVVIGTATAFYLIVGEMGHVAQWANVRDFTGFFGDFNSVLPNDAGRFIVHINEYSTTTGANLNQYNDSWTEIFSSMLHHNSFDAISSDRGRLLLRNADGSAGTRHYNIRIMQRSISSITDAVVTPTRKIGFYSPVLITLMMNANMITSTLRDDAGLPIQGSLLSPVYRGFLPGMIYEVFPRYKWPDNWPIIDELQGHNHFLLRSMTTVAPLWVNMEEWP